MGISESADRASGRLKLLARAVAGLGVGLPAVAGAPLLSARSQPLWRRGRGQGVLYGRRAAARCGHQLLRPVRRRPGGFAEGSAQAAAAQKAYANSLAAMPPATRETAKVFGGLKGDVKSWSDSLGSTTMPVFTKGIELLRTLAG